MPIDVMPVDVDDMVSVVVDVDRVRCGHCDCSAFEVAVMKSNREILLRCTGCDVIIRSHALATRNNAH